MIDPDILKELAPFGRVREYAPLREYTTFRAGGPADALVVPNTAADVPGIVRVVRERALPLTVIGGGSNLLVGDRGVRGVVLAIRERDEAAGAIAVSDNGDIAAEASVSKERFIDFAIANGFGGVEFMAGIPGCLGGGIIMNAGTTLGWFADILVGIRIVDGAGALRDLPVTKEMSTYRRLRIDDDSIIIAGAFRLPRAEDPASVRETIAGLLRERAGKHPLDYPSAGSVFKNPEGHSSWKLINDAGLKGTRIGGAMVSELHTNFIINYDNATARDIRDLIEHVRETVQAKFQVRLETEVRMLGEF
ncbi:MAG TPA: UDP-N-acetylmuramate dehydrogenase [Spirochaetota bacterium]|nr:UDP-N-acetylmuramate dehydrogenase [Spirochaetota bacterium]HNT13070.1 UDP-N-acetylmuramate dehydrogenase [Spirochaetota bacterium]HNV46951.1 UDP-N-acetylmuramate dehydrogenase [Spirochaetota bacterium]HOS39227.1 UDP-N-acetylmuramate dehydrogenase [Spirochaetota bacterium]HPI22906.1 UDP-N-acetylmuramate dehydrogenase [Spirochaetota bacterium]